MQNYINHMRRIYLEGDDKPSRTGVDCRSHFGGEMEFDLTQDNYPLDQSRKLPFKAIEKETRWFLKGSTDVKELNRDGVKIWDSWQGKDGTIGPMYGEQWRNARSGIDPDRLMAEVRKHHGSVSQSWLNRYIVNETRLFVDGGRGGVDQIQNIVDALRKNPDSRHMVVNVWTPSLLPDTSMSPSQNVDEGRMALAPCHPLWQVWTRLLRAEDLLAHDLYHGIEGESFRGDAVAIQEYTDFFTANLAQKGIDKIREERTELGHVIRGLSLKLYARSQDFPVGTVFNIASYALLAKMLAQVTNMTAERYIHSMGDSHIYFDQFEGVEEQLSRTIPLSQPKLILNPTVREIDQFVSDDFQLFDYHPLPAIKYPIAV